MALAALAFASQAFAAYTPEARRADGHRRHDDPPDDPARQTTRPQGSRSSSRPGPAANLGATAGSTIGTLDAKAAAAALGGATLPLTGTVQARAANGTYLSSGVAVPLAKGGDPMHRRPTTHAAFWVLSAPSAAGQTLEVPLFVDPTSGAISAASPYTLTLCLPPSDLPPEVSGGAAFGAKVFEANFTVKGIFTATVRHERVAVASPTPYVPAKGTPNAHRHGRGAVLRGERERSPSA